MIVDHIIHHIPERYHARVERYVIMPNHIHMIVVILDDEELRAIHESPLHGRSVVSKMIGYIKMNASKEIRNRYGDVIVWQRSFHDHIIRSRRDYEEISQYIQDNPRLWREDCLYSEG